MTSAADRPAAPGPTVAAGEQVMEFVGVSTGGSSIMRVFPEWARVLGLPTARLVGHDVPLGAPPERYRELVAGLKADPARLGALVTTHKTAVYAATVSLFDEVDEFATLSGEISSISKRGRRLIGHAKDPVTAGLAIEEFLDGDHFARTGGHVVCLGAGGAGTAIAWYLARRPDPPARIVATDVSADRLAALQGTLAGTRLVPDVHRVTGPADDLLTGLPPGSLVINATGLGKDRPGSPFGRYARFPAGCIAWELNYRGDLGFLRAAADQPGVTTVDGWRYFIHGWSQVVAEVFDIRLNADLVAELSRTAAAVR